MATIITGIRRAAQNAVMLCNRLARIAKDAVRVEAILEPFQTGSVVWEHFIEVFLGETGHLGFAVHNQVPTVTTQTVSNYLPTVKG